MRNEDATTPPWADERGATCEWCGKEGAVLHEGGGSPGMFHDECWADYVARERTYNGEES